MTEYEYEYYSTFQKWPNTNTNIIRFEKGDRIRIRILFGLKKATEYEYEYYSDWKNRPNTNTNIIRIEKIIKIRIRILVFGLNYSNNIRIPNYSLTSGPHTMMVMMMMTRQACRRQCHTGCWTRCPMSTFFLHFLFLGNWTQLDKEETRTVFNVQLKTSSSLQATELCNFSRDIAELWCSILLWIPKLVHCCGGFLLVCVPNSLNGGSNKLARVSTFPCWPPVHF